MFILGDETHDRGRIPFVTFCLIAVNILAFSAQIRFGERLTYGFALVPKEITEFRDLKKNVPVQVHGPEDAFLDEEGEVHFRAGARVVMVPHYPGPRPIVLTFITYQFLHGDFFHLLFNMWFLFIFGRNVECSLGHGRYLGFYLLCGVLAGIAQVGADASSVIPVVGASGAIAGVMGAYLAIFPWNNIKIVWGGIGLMFGIVQVPAFIVVGLWFMGEFLIGMATMNHDFGGGTAYWCHIGGFLAGFGIIKALIFVIQLQLKQLEAEREAERIASGELERPDDALPAPEMPTQAEFDNLLDPVEAFKRARQNVFRNAPENDPFLRPGEGPLVAELIKEVEEGITAAPPRDGIVGKLPRPRTRT